MQTDRNIRAMVCEATDRALIADRELTLVCYVGFGANFRILAWKDYPSLKPRYNVKPQEYVTPGE